MVKRLQLFTLLLFTAAVGAVSLSARMAEGPAAEDGSSRQEKTAEQVYKNIQVLKGVPASQLDAAMALISGSLGVKCSYCHAGPFEKDDKPTKQTARKMMRMVFELNEGSFNGQGAVSCFTCHRGRPRPESAPPVGQNLWLPPGPAAAAPAPLPSADQILERYELAVGGRQAIGRVTSRVLKGSRVGADGVLVPEEVYTKAPNKLLTVTSYPNLVFRTGFDGSRGWAWSSQGGRDLGEEMLAQLRREAEFYKETRLKEAYPKMVVVGTATVGGREAYLVEATPGGGGRPEKLYFDVQTGLLVRKYAEAQTVLGQFPTQTDYEDFREVDGVRLPFSIRWAIPGRAWGRKITEVKQNVPVDDALFSPPPGGK